MALWSKWLETGSTEFEFLDNCVWRKITAEWRPDWFEDASRIDRTDVLKGDCYVCLRFDNKKPQMTDKWFEREKWFLFQCTYWHRDPTRWSLDAYMPSAKRFGFDSGGYAFADSMSGVLGPYQRAIVFVPLSTRAAKMRSIVRLVGRFALIIKRIYTEVSFRPQHSGAKRTREHFEACTKISRAVTPTPLGTVLSAVSLMIGSP